MKLQVYHDIIKATKEKVNELLAVPRAYEQRKRAELEVAKIDAQLVSHEQKVQELAAKYPVDFDALLEALDEFALLERRKEQFNVVIAEMFPAASTEPSA